MNYGHSKKVLEEMAKDAFESKLQKHGWQSEEDKKLEQYAPVLPDRVEDLPPNGVVLVLTEGQSWLKEFDEIQYGFVDTDKANVKYLGLLWCSVNRQLTVFDCRNYHGGLYAYSDFAKRN